MDSTLPEVLTTLQAAALLQLRPAQVAIMAHRGELPAKMVAREWRFLRSKLLAYLAGEVEAPKPVKRGRGRPPTNLRLDLLEQMGGMQKVEPLPPSDFGEKRRQSFKNLRLDLLEKMGSMPC